MQQNEADTWYDQNGNIVFTTNIGLAGVGLQRNASKADLDNGISYSVNRDVNNLATNPATGETKVTQQDLDREASIGLYGDPSPYVIPTETNIALGWNDIQYLKAGDTVSKTYTDTTQSTGPIERTIVYEAPFFKPNREEDYAVAWEFFKNL